MRGLLGGVVSLVLGIILMAQVLMPQIKDTNTTDWSSGEIALWGIAGLGAVVGIVFGIFNTFGVGTN
jgi:hypothetical protein